jgi:hypothetical protein
MHPRATGTTIYDKLHGSRNREIEIHLAGRTDRVATDIAEAGCNILFARSAAAKEDWTGRRKREIGIGNRLEIAHHVSVYIGMLQWNHIGRPVRALVARVGKLSGLGNVDWQAGMADKNRADAEMSEVLFSSCSPRELTTTSCSTNG